MRLFYEFRLELEKPKLYSRAASEVLPNSKKEEYAIFKHENRFCFSENEPTPFPFTFYKVHFLKKKSGIDARKSNDAEMGPANSLRGSILLMVIQIFFLKSELSTQFSELAVSSLKRNAFISEALVFDLRSILCRLASRVKSMRPNAIDRLE